MRDRWAGNYLKPFFSKSGYVEKRLRRGVRRADDQRRLEVPGEISCYIELSRCKEKTMWKLLT
jgi:hypothetical protein